MHLKCKSNQKVKVFTFCELAGTFPGSWISNHVYQLIYSNESMHFFNWPYVNFNNYLELCSFKQMYSIVWRKGEKKRRKM